MRPFPVVAVALLLLVAGCAAPVADPSAVEAGSPAGAESPASTPGPNATESPADDAGDADLPPPEALAADHEIEVDDGVPADAALVFARVQVVTGEPDARPPDRVQVFDANRMQLGGGSVGRFRQLVGVTFPEGEELVAAGYVDGPDRIVLNEELLADAERTESVLAHESVHVVQYEQEAFVTTNRNLGPDREFRRTTDAGLTYRSVIEGTAMYAETAYWERYDGNGTAPNVEMRRAYENSSGAVRLGFAPYRFGAVHVDARVDDATELETVYEEPPRTTSEVLHGVDRDEPAVDPLNVTEVDAGDGDYAAADRAADRQGELFTRVMLAAELEDDRAAAAAAGWRNDRRAAFTDGSNRSYVWALRFEDAAEADTFAAAARDYFDARGERATVDTPNGERTVWRDDDPAATFRVERAGSETVVLVLGAERFVEGIGVDGDDDEVRVNAP